MNKFVGYKKGINLGGWLSQCSYEEKHIEEFICEEDIARIASWGCDHIRLPFDYNIVFTENGSVIESGFEVLERCVDWCEKYGLNIILDLHKTIGFSFDKNEQETGFFDNTEYQDFFVKLWGIIAERFGGRKGVAFELLNEITEQRFAQIWNRIAARTLGEIRKYTLDTFVIIGGIYKNSIFGLTLLDKPCDDYVVFNFHYYSPLVFTHQRAYWIDKMSDKCVLNYPDSTEKYLTLTLENVGEDLALDFKGYGEDTVDKRFIEKEMRVAADVGKKLDVPIYCGEYGVIDKVEKGDVLRWYKDVHEVFEELGFGRAVWNYRGKDFGLVDDSREEILDEIRDYF